MKTDKKRIIKRLLLIILSLLISCGKDTNTNTNTNIITIGNNITDTEAPQCTVKINNDASTTDSIDVTLSLSAADDTGVTGYYISESSMTPSLTGSGWVLTNSAKSYSVTVSYSLSSGSGTKTVYIWFRDAAERISTVASDSITFSSSDSTSPSNLSVSINSGDVSTTSTTVTLILSATDDVGLTGYCVKESSTTPSGNDSCWTSVTSTTSYSATVAFTLSSGSLGDNTKTVYVWFRDSAGNISASASDSITLTVSDTTTPSSPSLSINNGDVSTTSTAVTLNLSASDDIGVTGYCAKESSTTPSGNDSCWTSVTSTTSYSATVSFTLSSGSLGDNTKTVYVWFRDTAGNVSSSASDSITLTVSDATAPSSPSISINSGDASTTSTSVTLNLSATDDVGVTGYCAKESSATPSSNDSCWTSLTSTTSYSATVSFTLSSGSGTKTVYVWFNDSAGNVSSSASDSITFSSSDTTAPTNTTTSNFVNNGASETNSPSVTLSISASDNVAVTGYYVSENSTAPSASAVGWTSIVTVSNYTANVTFTLSNGDGIKTVYVWFKDAAGNVSTAASDSITYKAWTISTIDSIGDVGRFASMALDSNNKAHISYGDVTNQVLKYATNESGSWAISIANNSVGWYSSIAIDSNNKSHIIYLSSGVNDLGYATNASGAWVVTSLMSSATQIWGPSIAIDLNNKLHISCYNDSSIKYLTNVSGDWSSSTVDTGSFTRSTATERWTTSIVADSNNKVHISYAHSPDGFKYANNTSGAWAVATLDSVDAYYNSMEIDINGKAHISSISSNGDGNYATNASGSWVITRISGGSNDTYSSLALDSNDKVHINYGGYYVTNVTGIWVYSSVPTGWYSSMDIDSNNKIHISYFDSDNRDLKYATNQ